MHVRRRPTLENSEQAAASEAAVAAAEAGEGAAMEGEADTAVVDAVPARGAGVAGDLLGARVPSEKALLRAAQVPLACCRFRPCGVHAPSLEAFSSCWGTCP